jgi:hypothetical protein
MADRYPLIVNTGAAQIQELASGDNLNLTGSSISAVASITASGRITVNSGANVTAIANGASSGVGNIGATGAVFNTVFATATTALYADLAENYSADAEYQPGTVVCFGGSSEITVSDISHDTRVAGVISTQPAYLMNAGAIGLPVALTGRVPCQVQGPIAKGDRLVNISAGIAGRYDPALGELGCVLGKSLEDLAENQVKLIEIAVGKN